MKKFIYFLIFIWIIMIFIPMFCILTNSLNKSSARENHDALKYSAKSRDKAVTISVFFPESNQIKQMSLDKYLIGVVSAEMPASYNAEALKAQAVVARSYAYNKYAKAKADGGDKEHMGADICTSSEHCQAYMSQEEAIQKWGIGWVTKYYTKIEKAVYDTDGEILEYNKQPVNAVFHSASYGRTESAKDVWGNDVLYLKSVESPGDKTAMESQRTFSYDQFKKLMKNNFPDIAFSGDATHWIRNFKYSEGGSVLFVDVGNKTVKGSLMRSIFSLKSGNFEVIVDSKNIIFNVKGSGHGVGMSQYGANAMAGDGSGYKDILKWYYQGTDICFWGSTQ